MTISISLVLVLSLAGSVFAAAVYPTNASFETGDTTGWTETIPAEASINVVTSFTSDAGTVYNAQDGMYFAALKTDGPGSLTKLTQPISVAAGDTVSGWAFFDAWDYWPFNDSAEVFILAADGVTVVASVFYSDVAAVGDYGETLWTSWSHTFASAGTYYVEAQITNSLDSVLDSYMGLDLDDIMPTVSTSLAGPDPVEVGEEASWNITVTICPDEIDDSDDVVVQGGIGADLVVTHIDGTPVTNPMAKKTTQTVGDVTLSKKGGKMGATIVTWDVGDLTGGDSCQSIVITVQTGYNPKDKHEFTSVEDDHELDGGFSATFMYNDMEYETPETAPQTVDVVEAS